MYEIVITCLVCGAQRSISHLAEQPNFSDAEILEKAGHAPDCPLAQVGRGIVSKTKRDGEPTITLYSISEGS